MIADIQPRIPLEAPIDEELPFPDVDELISNQSSVDEAKMLLDYIPTLEDFHYDEQDFAKLETWRQNELTKTYPIVPGEDYGTKRLNELLADPKNFSDYFYVKNKLFQDRLRKTDLYPWISSG